MSVPLKILVVRLSSIGDIVLTSPVVRCLKMQLNAEIHFLTNEQHLAIVEHNPYIYKVHAYQTDIKLLKNINFDYLIDLHHNLKTFALKRYLKIKNKSVRKLNVEKFILTTFGKNILPKVHIVDRYLETVAHLGVTNDNQGLDFFIPENLDVPSQFKIKNYTAIVIGGQHVTKMMPIDKLLELCNNLKGDFVIIGGPEDQSRGHTIVSTLQKGVNGCGALSIFQSAFVIKHAQLVISHDTGMMHIAAAFKKKIVSVWGNTVPDFGMYPYLSDSASRMVEVKNLSCRPCSKIGYASCPKGHFKCMKLIDVKEVLGE